MSLKEFIHEKRFPIIMALIIIVLGSIFYFGLGIAEKSKEMIKENNNQEVNEPSANNLQNIPEQTQDGVLV